LEKRKNKTEKEGEAAGFPIVAEKEATKGIEYKGSLPKKGEKWGIILSLGHL